MARRMGHDAAIGLLGSYVSTETCRAAAESKMKAAGEAAVSGDFSGEHLLGLDDEFDLDGDVLGLDDEIHAHAAHEMNFAYGW